MLCPTICQRGCRSSCGSRRTSATHCTATSSFMTTCAQTTSSSAAHERNLLDWPHARRGAAWVDLPCLLPSIEASGGPTCEEAWAVFEDHDAPSQIELLPVISAFASFLWYQQAQPEIPQLPGLRAFQRAQRLRRCAGSQRCSDQTRGVTIARRRASTRARKRSWKRFSPVISGWKLSPSSSPCSTATTRPSATPPAPGHADRPTRPRGRG